MKWLRKLFGLDFPDPEVGQIWRSENSGRLMRVSSVETHDTGTVFIYTAFESPEWLGPNRLPWGIPMLYCLDFPQWRRRLREERRVLAVTDQALAKVAADIASLSMKIKAPPRLK